MNARESKLISERRSRVSAELQEEIAKPKKDRDSQRIAALQEIVNNLKKWK